MKARNNSNVNFVILHSVRNKVGKNTSNRCMKKKKIYPCFVRRDEQLRQVDVVHLKQKSFKCSMCQSNFGRKQSLQTHIRSIHGEKESFKCEICEAEFS